jgi:hypothetical protein
MKGTDKQIQWAEDIKQSIRDDIDSFFGGNLDRPRAKFALKIMDAINNIEDAEWFIDNRQFDITKYAKTVHGTPDMQRLNREHPEIAAKLQ